MAWLRPLVAATSLLLFGIGCGGAPAAEEDEAVTLEGLTEEDAERAAARALATANAKRLDFERGEGGSANAGGVRPANVDLGGDLGAGTWAYDLRITTDGRTSTSLGSANTETAVLGASTFKLFTGFAAFANKTVQTSTLAYMLRTSSNPLANFAMCKNGVALGEYRATCKSLTNATTAMKMPTAIAETLAWHREQGEKLSTSLTMVDGSGLKVENKLLVGDLVEVLMAGRRHPDYAKWKDLLAQPGVSSTLMTRFPGYEGKLFAKTGTYFDDGGGVKSLAGYVELSNNRTMVFAIVGNGVGDPKTALDRIEKGLLKAIAEAEAN